MGRSKKKLDKKAESQRKKTDCSVLSLLLLIFFYFFSIKKGFMLIFDKTGNMKIFFEEEYDFKRLLAGSNAEQMDLQTLHRYDRREMIQPDVDFMMEME